ncbi:MAG TPA: UDP-3-O-(3-hydroxymyristoyl)glucosamine N-acyltransferase [Armatimonadota bacterium]|nr:UDP-3-O-(3-hydroxymyristoyl)glucosamine N-acyltransferase [Armatimonadota bacterium]
MWKSLRELAELVEGDLEGDPELRISGAADIADAEEGDIVFAETPRFVEEARKSRASAIIAYRGARNSGKPTISVANPRYAFAQALNAFSPAKTRESGIHPTSVVGPGASIGENPSIGFDVYIGRNASIGNNAWIYPFVFIGDNVRLGDNCIIYPFVALYDGVTIGNDVIVHSGAVIGADGFGFTKVGGEHYKMPQIGTVVVGDYVEIGANVTIDRARTGKTVIGRGTKIDNLVHIAHNVKIGENCVVVAQVGISGSVDIGDRVVLAGQAGLKDHITVGDDAVICARAGVIGDIGSGEFVSGFPARSHKEEMRIHAAQQRLPALLRLVKDLERRIKELEGRSKE